MASVLKIDIVLETIEGSNPSLSFKSDKVRKGKEMDEKEIGV